MSGRDGEWNGALLAFKWRPSTSRRWRGATLRANGGLGVSVAERLSSIRFLPFVLSVAPRQRREVEGRHLNASQHKGT